MTLDLSYLVSLALVFLYLYKHALHGNQLSVVGASVFLDLNEVYQTICRCFGLEDKPSRVRKRV